MTRPLTIAAIGTPCGGTTGTTEVLTHRGFRVGHEREGRDGFSCGFAAWARERSEGFDPREPITADNHPGYRPRCVLHERPKLLVWVIRHPLRTAETLPYYLTTCSEIAIQAHPPEVWVDDRILRSLRYWVHTHERIQELQPDMVVRVGPRYDEDAVRMLERLGRLSKRERKTAKLRAIEGMRRAHKSEQMREQRLSWRQWERLDPEYAARARGVMAAAEMTDEDMDKREGAMEALGWV